MQLSPTQLNSPRERSERSSQHQKQQQHEPLIIRTVYYSIKRSTTLLSLLPYLRCWGITFREKFGYTLLDT
jgi:hypothetical protein